MQIRTFDLMQDYPAVRALWEHAAPGVTISPSDEMDELGKKLQRDPELFLVMEEEGQILGTVIGGYDGRRGMVYHLVVTPDRQGEGIGTALMQEVENRLRNLGCYKYYLLVRKEAYQAVDFYQTLGCELMDIHILGKVLS